MYTNKQREDLLINFNLMFEVAMATHLSATYYHRLSIDTTALWECDNSDPDGNEGNTHSGKPLILKRICMQYVE